jgi:thiamine monophosphate synthase
LGVRRLRLLALSTKTPVFALGGVNDSTVQALAGSGIKGLAAIEALN